MLVMQLILKKTSLAGIVGQLFKKFYLPFRNKNTRNMAVEAIITMETKEKRIHDDDDNSKDGNIFFYKQDLLDCRPINHI